MFAPCLVLFCIFEGQKDFSESILNPGVPWFIIDEEAVVVRETRGGLKKAKHFNAPLSARGLLLIPF